MADKETFDLTKLNEKEKNYNLWKFGIEFLLDARGLIGFVEGTEKEPNKESKKADWTNWKQSSSKAVVILLGSVEKSIHAHLQNCRSPKEIWDKLQQLYGSTGHNARDSALQDYFDFRIKDGLSIALQLEQFETICRRLVDVGEPQTDASMVIRILHGLPQKFSAFRMAWECTPAEEQKKNNLVARLLREDKRLCEVEESTESLALQIEALKLKLNSQNPTSTKSKAGKVNGKKSIEELKKRTKCAACKQKGHWARECPSKKNNNTDSGASSYIATGYICDVSAFYSKTTDRDEDIWLADSGASKHMTFRKDFFTSLNPVSEFRYVKIADDKLLPTEGSGTVVITERVNGKLVERELQNVLFVPQMRRNLFSVSTINDKKFSFHTFEKFCEVRDKNSVLTSTGVRHGNLFKMNFEAKIPQQCNIAEPKQSSLKLWHERMGHINVRALLNTSKVLSDQNLVIGKDDDFKCTACIMGKQTRKPHFSIKHESNFKPGEKIHTDVCGPINVESPRGSRYFLLFKDECTSFKKVYFLRHKSEVFEGFKVFQTFVHTQTGNKIKVLRSDNGREYTSEEFRKHTTDEGIIHEFSSPYIHEQNGRAEREMRTLVESARAMLISSGVDLKLWPEAINTACYVLNRVAMQGKKKTPFEEWFNCKPQIKHLRVFGIDAYLNIPKEKRRKFQAKSTRLIFVGYEGESTNYRLWDKKSNKIFVSSDVDFIESIIHDARKEVEIYRHEIDFSLPEFEVEMNDEEPAVNHQPAVHTVASNQHAVDEVGDIQQIDQENQLLRDVAEPGRRSLRDRSQLQPVDRYGIPIAYIADTIPMNYANALASPNADKWKEAMQEEMNALLKSNTWILQVLPKGKRAIGCKWVYAIKRNAIDNSTRYKARLVAKGYSQREGIDFFDTFAPVVRYESIRILLAMAAREDLEIAQFDVKTAFLYGDLQEDIYLQQPEGYITEEGLVCKLQRSLYGLKQSPHCWNKKFVYFLEKFNLKSTESDKCLFIGKINNFIVYLALYVDDGLVICKSQDGIDSVLSYLMSHFEITVNEVNEFVGMQIKRDRPNRLIKISQSNYIDKIVNKFRMSDAYAVSTPAEPGTVLSKFVNGHDSNDNIPYREAVGSLLFAARVSRPDIEYAVNYASQFLNCFREEHWRAVKRIFRYLIGTRDFGLTFGNSGSSDIFGYTDADYAGCVDTRRSRSGFVFVFNGGPICWSSQKQDIVATSTAEAEYIALSHGAKEAIWLRQMLSDLKISCVSIPMYIDNQSAIKLAKNSEFHKRSKHIDVRFHFVRDVVNRKEIELNYVQSKQQLADIFTKPLAKQQFCILREQLNILDISN